MKKSKTVIVLGIFFIFSAFFGIKNSFTSIENILIFNIILAKYYAISWYLFWSLLGLAIGVGFIMHKYIYWKIAVIEYSFFLVNFIFNAIFASNKNISIIFKGAVDPNQYKIVASIPIILSFILLTLIIGQKKAFTQR